jgi:hypothetical protein
MSRGSRSIVTHRHPVSTVIVVPSALFNTSDSRCGKYARRPRWGVDGSNGIAISWFMRNIHASAGRYPLRRFRSMQLKYRRETKA